MRDKNERVRLSHDFSAVLTKKYQNPVNIVPFKILTPAARKTGVPKLTSVALSSYHIRVAWALASELLTEGRSRS